MDEPIRIISDLHLGHTASLAREIAQVEPLFCDVRTLIFNGDTVEMRSERNRERAGVVLAEIQSFCAERPVKTWFINGNHDPNISTLNHLELDQGQVLVTHGDVLYHEAESAWTRGGVHRGARPRLVMRLDAHQRATLEDILSTNKRVTQELPVHLFDIPNGTWGQFTTFMRQTWPPQRLVKMVTSWRDNPVHAIDLLQLYRPQARCVIVGHTHFPGIWQHRGRHVINTGSYLPVLGRLAVDYADGRVIVRKVVFRRKQFHLGRQVASFRIHAHARAA